MKVLLLNPPGDKIYLRDYYCSQISKADYIPPPIDLLVQSGILSKSYDVSVIDGIASKHKEKDCLELVLSGNFDVIVFLTSFLSWKEDSCFMQKVKENTVATLIGCGDILYFEGKKVLAENEFIDAALTDFCSDGILKYLSGEPPSAMIVRSPENKILRYEEEKKTALSYPLPRHDLFPIKSYRWPFSKYHPVSSLLTNYGCPFKCSFCSYEKFPFSIRPVTDVIEEMKDLTSMGIREVYIKDLTFGAVKEHALKLCEEMISKNINISWSCFSRVDVIDEELLSHMKSAGCHTIMFGIESANEKSLEKYKKGVTRDKIVKAFSLCKKYKISTLATFILGLPGERREDIMETINFSKTIKCDYASFNLAEAPPGSSLRDRAIKKSWINPGSYDEKNYGTEIPESDGMTKYDKMKLIRMAERKFYLRPSYVLKQLLSISSFYEFKNMLAQGTGLLFRK